MVGGLMAPVDGDVVDSCPRWVGTVFADLYPDDAIELDTDAAVTVLACDDDWDWIAQHTGVVVDAIEHVLSLIVHAGEGQWVVCTDSAGGVEFTVCTAGIRPDYDAAGVGSVVVFGRPPTIDRSLAGSGRRLP
ncbi:MAG: hypothetical protein C0482_23470 [Gordonia sp.]|nr:hypothetical protein [Gordonia sp. (in: high G+C Gram-positive bacteria)]